MPRRRSLRIDGWMRRASGVLVATMGLVAPPSDVAAQAGVIEGRVTLEEMPRRRSAPSYGGRRGGSAEIQPVPAMVYVVGAVAGAGTSPPSASMVQRDTAFAPAAVAVGVGGSVDFPNEDPFFHNVFSYSSTQRFDLGRYPQGESKSVTFDEAGIVEVFCEVHRQMRSAILVTENALHAVVSEDGSFRIEGVPPGEHAVAFWSADHEAVERTVRVTPGGTAWIELELRR